MATGKLKEVEEDAMRITAKRFRDNEEDLQYAQLRDQPRKSHTPEEVLQGIQSQTSSTPVKSKVELVSYENLKIETNTDSTDEKKGKK